MPQQSLEQEAMDRVRRMYAPFDSRAPRAEPSGKTKESGKVKADPRAAEQGSSHARPMKPKEREAEPPVETNSPSKPVSLLDVYMKDKDQSLILLLLVLLMKDGADMNLTLALMYLLI